MKHIISLIDQYLYYKLVTKGKISISSNQYGLGLFSSRELEDAKSTNLFIYEGIQSGKPFLAGRFGGFELNMMKMLEFDIKSKQEEALRLLCKNAGFFPEDMMAARRFLVEMERFCDQVDVLGVWWQPFEGYFIRKYMQSDIRLTKLQNLEPWKSPELPWTDALKNKRVLVVHPFAETIQSQYKKRKLLFPVTEILPEFELYTLKAVQTLAGEKDPRFESWFDALDWMTNESLKINFDVAIIGCGAYGAPLAARIKEAGKQAIHLAGVTQILFGIIGKRWDGTLNNKYGYIQELFNDAWVRPNEKERPQNSVLVEDSCYW